MKRQSNLYDLVNPTSFNDRPMEFSFEELVAATNNFSFETKIGGGNFSVICKGKLTNRREVAIKRKESLSHTNLQNKESIFQSELDSLSHTHPPQACDGLGGLLSSNFLLDMNWVARVSSFSFSGPESKGELRAPSTISYMDTKNYGFNFQSYVHGFGIVVLQVLTCRRSWNITTGEPINIVEYVVPFIEVGEINKLLNIRVRQPLQHEAEGWSGRRRSSSAAWPRHTSSQP
ncbi:hypothetical protein ZIOFF_012917 [Zingiber officinale]|uniref:Protein kinase domain-containing protein n=1 Tax=Zingiber officinale TaxID=94328 RepID=A0A8J5LPI7_ZINOF|nr:hypothetical protein ZIOFF_012917 [Zingiber officinale]